MANEPAEISALRPDASKRHLVHKSGDSCYVLAVLAALLLFSALRVEVVETEAVPVALADQLAAWVGEEGARHEGKVDLRLIGGATRVLLILETDGRREEIAEPQSSDLWRARIAKALAELFPPPKNETPLAAATPPPVEKPTPWLELSLAGGGIASSAAAIVLALQADSAQNALKDRVVVDQNFRDEESSIRKQRTLSLVLLSTGATLLISSLLIYAL